MPDKLNNDCLRGICELIDRVHINDLIIDFNGEIIHCGPEIQQKLPFQAKGLTLEKIFRSEQFETVTDLIHHAKTEKVNDFFELKENRSIHYRADIHHLQDELIYIRCKQVYAQDLHSRDISSNLIKNIDPNLSVSDFLLNVLYNLPSDIEIFDTDHRYIYANPKGIKDPKVRNAIFGKTAYEYSISQGLDVSSAEKRKELFELVLTTGKTQSWEDTLTSEDGQAVFVLRRYTPVFENAGKISFVISYGVDITQVKESQALAELNAQKFKSLFDNNMAGVFRTREDGKIMEVNRAYADIYGFDSIDELKTHKSSEFYPNAEARNLYLQTLKEKGQLKNYLILNKRKDGRESWLLSNVSYRKEDNVGFIEGTLIDVTPIEEAKMALQHQKSSLERLAFFLDQSTDGIQVMDENGRFVFLNKAARERLGIHEAEIQQKTIFDIESYFKTQEEWDKHFSEVWESGYLRLETQHMNTLSGKRVPVEVTVIPREFEGQKYMISTAVDITERIESQKALEEKNKFLEDLNSVIDSSSIVSVTDIKGNILRVNENFCEISGYSEAELIGKNHNVVNSGYHTKEFWKNMYETLYNGTTWQGEIRNKGKNGEYYWVNTIIYPIRDKNNKLFQFMSVRQEITLAKQNEMIIYKQVSFQDLLIRTANKLIDVNPELLDETINESLKDIGLFVDADRSYIFEYDTQNETTSNTYEWCREGIEPQIENLQEIPFSEIPLWVEKHFKGEIMDIPSVPSLPEGKLKELLEVQDILSVIAIPLMDGKVCKGFIGFDSVRHEHPFGEKDRMILELFADMIVNINKRIEFINEIEYANKRYLAINDGLEKLVAEKTAKNNELTQMMSNQDKLAMIGEITAGITHDLNTPIGAVKVGAESVRYTLENLFKSVLEKCSFEQLHFSCQRAVETNVRMFVGGLQMMRETNEMEAFLKENYPQLENVSNMANALVKSRITPTEKEVIDKIISSPNSIEFSELIYHIQSVRTFIDTVIEAGEKAASVIKNLRFYLKEGDALVKTEVNISQNIYTVLNVFNHHIKSNIELHVNIPDNLIIKGYETKLYQLWSNLIKNAIEAIGPSGELSIDGKKEGNKVIVSIKNTGEMIPAEIQERIFEKFFTTKAESNGTGLGLSIVKKVIEEHAAEIKLESNEDFTCFHVIFTQEFN